MRLAENLLMFIRKNNGKLGRNRREIDYATVTDEDFFRRRCFLALEAIVREGLMGTIDGTEAAQPQAVVAQEGSARDQVTIDAQDSVPAERSLTFVDFLLSCSFLRCLGGIAFKCAIDW